MQGQQAPLGAELLQVFRDFGGDAPDHLHALHDGGDVAHGRAVAHLEDGEGLQDLVEALTVAVERIHRQVGAREQGLGLLHQAMLGAHVDGNHAHRRGQGQDRQVGLTGGALRGAVAHAGLVGGNRGVREELHVGLADAPQVGIDDDGTVHLAQLTQTRGRESDVEVEAARADGLDFGGVSQDDEGARVGALDSFQSFSQWRTGRDCAQCLAKDRCIGRQCDSLPEE